jgi:hypothetical protein
MPISSLQNVLTLLSRDRVKMPSPVMNMVSKQGHANAANIARFKPARRPPELRISRSARIASIVPGPAVATIRITKNQGKKKAFRPCIPTCLLISKNITITGRKAMPTARLSVVQISDALAPRAVFPAETTSVGARTASGGRVPASEAACI